jgi:hypothetical protein
VVNHGIVLAVTGTSEAWERVTFAGDHRPMAYFLMAVENSDEPQTANVARYQILSRSPVVASNVVEV